MTSVTRTLSAGLLLLCAALLCAPSQLKLDYHQSWAVQESARAGAAYAGTDQRPMEHEFTPTLQALIWRESSFCIDKHDLDPDAYGCGQLKVKTARMFDAGATAKKLMRDDRYNIWLSATYLAWCRKRAPDWSAMVRCYGGASDADPAGYVKSIRERLQQIGALEVDDE